MKEQKVQVTLTQEQLTCARDALQTAVAVMTEEREEWQYTDEEIALAHATYDALMQPLREMEGVVVSKCTRCDGDGWLEIMDPDHYGAVVGVKECSHCNGSGTTNFLADADDDDYEEDGDDDA